MLGDELRTIHEASTAGAVAIAFQPYTLSTEDTEAWVDAVSEQLRNESRLGETDWTISFDLANLKPNGTEPDDVQIGDHWYREPAFCPKDFYYWAARMLLAKKNLVANAARTLMTERLQTNVKALVSQCEDAWRRQHPDVPVLANGLSLKFEWSNKRQKV